MKVYLAGGISDVDRKRGQRETAQKIREMGFEVYSASENDSINDKSKGPVTPEQIYQGDIDRVKECDIFVVRISGGNEDGTLSEIGMVAGWNEYEYLQKIKLNKHYEPYKPIKIVAYTTNERLLHPDFSDGLASAGFNHLVKGMIDKWGVKLGPSGRTVGTESEMLEYMKSLMEGF